MTTFAKLADLKAIEAEMPWTDRGQARSMYDYLGRAKAAHGGRPAISYQLLSGPETKKVTLTWTELHAQVTQVANLFRSLGVGETDVVAFVMPNAMETAVTLLAGAVAGIVNPINPLLEPEKISAILRETGAKVVVTLKPFPKTDLAQKVAEAVKYAPNVKTVLEVDLVRYLSGLKKGFSLHLNDVKLPKGVTAVTHGKTNPVLVSVVATVAEEAAPAAAPADAKAAPKAAPKAEAKAPAKK